ncbi:predicted protein [Chaetoceros tenuissimus]|uniref:Uncharacterized protein n=1 Tax=Chaetoceros tenuissimus TaxID=426638 RepID=A0AAD3CN49_9STRA|nr:predicted protein [Chaetoceros tenuissimus]
MSNQEDIMDGIPTQRENATTNSGLSELDEFVNAHDKVQELEGLHNLGGGVAAPTISLGNKVVILRGSKETLGELLCAGGEEGKQCCSS